MAMQALPRRSMAGASFSVLPNATSTELDNDRKSERQMKRCLLAVLSVFYLSATSLAADKAFTGNDLHELCVSRNEKGDLACTSWISGFKSGLFAAQEMAEGKGASRLCLSNQVTSEQARLIIVKFMKDYPNTLHYSASIVAFSALEMAFPCKNSN